MKCKRLISLFTLLPFCLGAQIGGDKTYATIISTNVLYKVKGDKQETLYFQIKSLKRIDYIATFRLYNNRTNALLFSASETNYIPKEGVVFSITYPLRYKLTGDGLRFQFELSDGNKIERSSSGVLYPYIHSEINAATYKNSVYTTENCFIKLEMLDVVTGESFGFQDYNEYLSKNKDNSIDFTSINMQYFHTYSFNYLQAEYHIKDYNNIYPNLVHVDDEVVLKMKCTKTNNTISFTLDEKMYVNPQTLEMSSSKLSKYRLTNNLFIPVGKEELLQENDSYILIKEAGYSAIDIKLPLTYYFNKHLIGLCYDSDYCLIGGVRE